jgi:hypothetical protein
VVAGFQAAPFGVPPLVFSQSWTADAAKPEALVGTWQLHQNFSIDAMTKFGPVFKLFSASARST